MAFSLIARWLAAAVLLLAATAASAARWGADYFPNVPVQAQDGRTLRFYDDVLKGRAVAVNVIYTSCKDECPLETAQLAQVQRLFGERMGRDVTFVSITLDPARDTAPVLKAYADKFGVGPGWLFLTGKKADLQLIIRKLGLSRAGDVTARDGHAASLMVGDEPSGQWMRNSAVDNPAFLAATIGNFLGWRDAAVGTADYAKATPLTIDKGQHLFESRCSACHSVGGGDRIGPDLAGVTQRRERAWVARYISAPEKVRAASDPAAAALAKRFPDVRMPNLGLGTQDVGDLLGFLARGEVPR
jgi:protein SCO1/2